MLRFRDNIAATVSVLIAAVALAAWSVWSSRQPQSEDVSIVSVAVSKTGQWLAAGTTHGRVAVWNRDDRSQLLRGDHGTLNDLQFSPDERWLAIADRGLTLRPLDPLEHPLIIRDDNRNYGTVRFSPIDGTILTITGEGIIETLQSQTAKTITRVCCSTIGGEVAFSPDGLFLLCAGHWPGVWEVRSGNLVARLTRAREFMTFRPIAFRGGDVLMGSQDGGIRIWDLATKRLIGTSPRLPDWVDTIAVQENTGLIVHGCFGKSLRVWNPETNLQQLLVGAQPTSNVLFNPSDGSLIMGTGHGSVEFWDIQHSHRKRVLAFPAEAAEPARWIETGPLGFGAWGPPPPDPVRSAPALDRKPMHRTKMTILGLLFTLFFLLFPLAQEEYLLRMKTWGMPGENQFQVDIHPDGLMIVQQIKPPWAEKDKKPKVVQVKLTPTELQKVHKMAIESARSGDFQKGCSETADGQNARISVWVKNQPIEKECIGAIHWPAKASQTETLLNIINSKLPKEIEVY
jgi:hypothetical protein